MTRQTPNQNNNPNPLSPFVVFLLVLGGFLGLLLISKPFFDVVDGTREVLNFATQYPPPLPEDVEEYYDNKDF